MDYKEAKVLGKEFKISPVAKKKEDFITEIEAAVELREKCQHLGIKTEGKTYEELKAGLSDFGKVKPKEHIPVPDVLTQSGKFLQSLKQAAQAAGQNQDIMAGKYHRWARQHEKIHNQISKRLES